MTALTRRTFVKSAVSVAASAAVPQAVQAATARRPNILFILPDEWRATAFGYAGNMDVQTPHIDKLAAEGVVFTHAYANTPVCCPARSVMLTGTYASTTGMVANDLRFKSGQPDLATEFDNAGYETAYFGKWHLDGGPRQPGYVPPERRHGWQYWCANECNPGNFNSTYFRNSDEPIHSTTYEPEMWVNEAIQYLGQRDKTKPFFMMVSMSAPHDPYIAPERYMKMYDPTKLSVPPNFIEGTPKGSREDLAHYYAGCSGVDDQIGRLMDKLKASGLDQDTIVLFSSDHGNMLGSQGAIWKRKPYEESIRVPCIVRYPRKIKAGRKSEAFFTHVDYAPTLLSLCGIGIPKATQGTDLAPTVLGKPQRTPASAFFQIFGPSRLDGVAAGWRGIRNARYTYARYEEKPWLLYDNESDPYQLHNLVDDRASRSVVNELDVQLTAWMKRTGDSWSKDWHDDVEDGGVLYNTETFETVDEYIEWKKAHPDSPAKLKRAKAAPAG